MSTYYGCPICGYRVVSQETGKCPSCDEGVLGDVFDTTPRPKRKSQGSRSYYFRVTLNTNGKLHSFNVYAVSERGARSRAIKVCANEGWRILTLEGAPFHSTNPGEPEHSIKVVRLAEMPSQSY